VAVVARPVAELVGVRVIRLMTRNTRGVESEVGTRQSAPRGLQFEDVAITDQFRPVTRPARVLLVSAGQLIASRSVVEIAGLPADEVEVSSEMFFVTLGAFGVDGRVVSGSVPNPCFQSRVAIEAERSRNATLTKLVTFSAVSHALEVGMRFTELAGRDDLSLHRYREYGALHEDQGGEPQQTAQFYSCFMYDLGGTPCHASS